MGNLRQSMTDEEWEALSYEPSQIKHSWSRFEIMNLIYQFSKDAMISNVPETDVWINNWLETNMK